MCDYDIPMVSVIIPVYKSRKVLETAVKSVQAQSFSDFEILLIEDGSPDDSLQLCQDLKEKDSRIRVFHKENGGICSARNYGLEKARGKYVAFLDHDDEYLPGYLEDNVQLLEKHSAEVVKFERLREQHSLDGKIKLIHANRISKMQGFQDGIVCYRGEEIAKRYSSIRDAVKAMYIWDAIYKREFIEKNHLRFDESFKLGHEDVMFNLEVLAVANVMVFNGKEYYKHKYREETSTSAVFNTTRIDDAIKIVTREACLLTMWHYPEADILLSYINELFMVLNILSLPSAQIPYKEKKVCLEKYRKNTMEKLKTPNKSIHALLKKRWMHGALAWIFWMRRYRVCLFLFRVYKH